MARARLALLVGEHPTELVSGDERGHQRRGHINFEPAVLKRAGLTVRVQAAAQAEGHVRQIGTRISPGLFARLGEVVIGGAA